MTKQEFISYASKQLGFKNSSYESASELDTYIGKRLRAPTCENVYVIAKY